MSRRDSLLIVGCGNGFGGDDGVGLKVVPKLAEAWRGRGNVEFLIMPRAGIELMDVFEREETILFIDAITSGRQPGTVVITPLPTDAVQQRSSLGGSGFGITEILALARSLGRRIPRTVLLGIEVSPHNGGGAMSEPVARAMQYVVKSLDEVRVLLSTRELIAFEPELEPLEEAAHA